MRAPWIGLISNLSEEEIFILAIIQSQTTHGHPISWLVSGIAAVLTRRILEVKQESHYDVSEPYLVILAKEICQEFSDVWCEFGDYEFIMEVTRNLSLIIHQWQDFISYTGDHCKLFGEGWVADEALYTSLAAASKFINDPFEAIKALVYTNGDSDSLATLAGSFLGALHGGYEFNIERIRNHLEKRYSTELSDVVKRILGENE